MKRTQTALIAPNSTTIGEAEEPPGAGSAVDGVAAHVRRLSDQLVAAQRPLRLLEAIRWDEQVEIDFFDSGCRDLPRVDRAYYEARPLPFDIAAKRAELSAIERDVTSALGESHPAAELLRRRCRQYLDVVDLLEARGTSKFAAISRRLFGDSQSVPVGALSALIEGQADDTSGSTLAADEAAVILGDRLATYFGCERVAVRVTSGLASDASAGAGYLKLRAGAKFSLRDVRMLEVHEGWVHLGTTLNGLAQRTCGFLSRTTPATTATQEGLAVLAEVLTSTAQPARIRRLMQRVEAVGLAERGADFLDVFRHFAADGDAHSAYQLAARTFRGSCPTYGPFTKDLVYARGLLELCSFLRDAIRSDRMCDIPLLFCGKVGIDDVPYLAQLQDEGLLTPPRHTPPVFADVRGLCAWVDCVSWLKPR